MRNIQETERNLKNFDDENILIRSSLKLDESLNLENSNSNV